jgi:hypothetical protein
MQKTRTIVLMLMAISSVVVLTGCKTKPASTTDMATQPTKTNPTDDGVALYQIKNGTIEYTLSGTETGTETVYFADSGNRIATYTNKTLSIAGITRKTNTITLMEQDWIYIADLETMKGTKIQNTSADILKEMSANPTQMGEGILEKMGAVKEGTETVAGKTCDTWKIQSINSTVCVWKGLALKAVTAIGGVTITKVATSIDTDVPPSNKFDLPEGITFTTASISTPQQ